MEDYARQQESGLTVRAWCELYFEDPNIEEFVEKLESLYTDVKYVNHLMTHSWGQKVIRLYDPDGNLIEVGTPM